MPAPTDGAIVIRCFHGNGTGGNWHRVIPPSTRGWNLQRAAALSLQIAPTIVVLIKQDHCEAGGNLFSLAFFCNGVSIARCGSGSLAAARALMRVDSSLCTPLNFATSGGPVQVVSDGSGRLGYKIKPLPYFHDEHRQCWQGIIDRKLRHSVLIGSAHDYCLLELQTQAALAQCHVNSARLLMVSKRALIVTAISPSAPYDYALRYFSPQYGQYEDSATGSAHAMVAAYWQSHFSRRRIRGLQQSAGGGEFIVQRVGLEQVVYGRAD